MTEQSNLVNRLLSADICCHDCGAKYGKYSVGCSSTWQAECPICGETKGVTEVRDYGYLDKGISEIRAAIKEQSKKVANYMADQEIEEEFTASYEKGEITLKLTEDEVGFLNECLDVIAENHLSLCPGHTCENPEDIALFESIEKKITELYADYCVKYQLSPALKAYNAKYGTWGHENDIEMARWEGFLDAFVSLMSEKQ